MQIAPRAATFDIQPANEPALAVINVNVTRLVVANKPFQNMTAVPDVAHTLETALRQATDEV